MIRRLLCIALAAVMLMGLLLTASADVLTTSAVEQMTASDACVAFIKEIEGFHAVPYWDYSQWTVGYGTACPDEDLARYKAEGISPEEAEKLLLDMMSYFNSEVNKFMTRFNIKLTQQQYDAIFSLSYNCGTAWLYKSSHAMVQAIVSGSDPNYFVYLMSLRSTAGGEFLEALLRRRLMEADMYLNGRYSNKVHADYGWVYYDSGRGTCTATAQGYDMNLPAKPCAVPTYDGYIFRGWYTAPTGGLPVTKLDASTNQMTLYAHWEKVGVGDSVSSTPVDNISVTATADVLSVHTGPGLTYHISTGVSAGTKLVITAVTTRNGSVWGKCKLGWVNLTYTDYKPETQDGNSGAGTGESGIVLPAMATVLSDLTIRNGPHKSYPTKGVLKEGTQIEIQEVTTFLGTQWVKVDRGWVKLESSIMLHDENTLTHSFIATVTNSTLNVRSGPGTSYALAGSLKQGDKLRIAAIVQVGDAVWGRCAKGWISLQYTDFSKDMLERYQKHVYGSWYDIQAATCTAQGVQQRDCLDCSRSETQLTELADHSYGLWYQVKEETTTEPGLEKRDCELCDHYETRETEVKPSFKPTVYATVACDVLNIRKGAGADNEWVGTYKKGARVEIFEQTTVGEKLWGRTDRGWICLTGYVALDDEPKVMTVTATKLNIRSGAGTSNKVVGTLTQGAQVTVLEQVTVGTTLWARIEQGWVSMDYLK